MDSKFQYKSKINFFALLSLLLINIPFVNGQYTGASFILNSPSNAATYTARDFVSLKVGFTFTPTSLHYFNAKIDQTTIPNIVYQDASTIFNRTLDKNLPVGSLPGNYSVSLAGTSGYSIPIEVAPGTGGMQPNVIISYNSSGGNGLLGLGFRLGGFSSITRTNQNLFNDGNIEEVNFTSSDRLTIDGQRLIITNSGGYLDNNVEYRTEIESYLRIISKVVNGQQYFIVYASDGKITEYGNTVDSRIYAPNGAISNWLVNKVTDANGNYLTYSYTKNETLGTWMPKEINYTGNTSVSITPYNKMVFYYEGNRPDTQQNYTNGVLKSFPYLLTKIKTYNENSLIKEYQLNYSYDSNDANVDYNSKLVEIKCINNGVNFNSTVFKWGDNTAPSSVVDATLALPPDPQIAINYPNYEENYSKKCSGDFDGDGMQEIINVHGDGINNIRFDTYYDPTKTNNIISYTAYNINNLYYHLTPDVAEGLTNDMVAIDVDGDGIDELVLIDSYFARILKINNTGVYSVFTSYYISLPTGITPSPYDGCMGLGCTVQQFKDEYSLWLSNMQTNANNIFKIGDFNGDGQTDFLIRHENINGYYWTISGFKEVNGAHNWVVDWDYSAFDKFVDVEKLLVADFNGDGKSEVLTNGTIYKFNINTGDFELFSSPTDMTNIDYEKVQFADFNGDGNADIFYRKNGDFENEYIWSAKLFDGKNVFTEIFSQEEWIDPLYPDKNVYECGDFNGDGKADIIYYSRNVVWVNSMPDHNESKLNTIFFNKGTGFYPFNYNIDLNYNIADDKISEAMISDINGDGQAEFYNGDRMITFFPNLKSKLLTKVENGLGKLVTFNYETTSNSNIYQRATTGIVYPFKSVSFPFYVVNSALESIGMVGSLNASSQIDYTYQDAIIHLRGKGFLTFKNVSSKNINEEKITQSTFAYQLGTQLLPFSYIQEQAVKRFDNSTIANTSVEKASPAVITYNGLNRYRIFDNSMTSNNYLNNTKKYTSLSAPDANYGNVLSVTEEIGQIGSAFQWQTTSTRTYQNIDNLATGKWILGLPTSVTTVKTRAGESTSQTNVLTSSFDSNNGHLLTQTAEPNTDLAITTTNEYYAIGALKKTTVLAVNDNKTRFSSIEYDGKYRFATKKTNQLGYTNLFTYENNYGNVLTETDANGHTITNQYDAFGKVIKTIDILGNETTATTNWVTSSNTNAPSGSMFYITQSKTGVSPSYIYFDIVGKTLGTESKNFGNFTVLKKNTYNIKNLLVTETLPYYVGATPQTINYTYDEYNRMLTKVGPTENSEISYSTNSSTSTNHLLGISTVTSYDFAGNVISTNDGTNLTSFAYNSAGLPKTITDNEGNQTLMTYNNIGKKLTLTDPDLGLTSYSYTGFGELSTQTDARLKVNTLIYDEIGRLATKTVTAPNDTVVTYTYGTTVPSIGLLLTKEIGQVDAPTYYKETYTYNNNSQNTGKTVNMSIGSHVHTYNSTMTYDNLGRVQQYNYPTGLGIIYNYNAYTSEVNQITKASDGSNIWQCNAENYLGQITNITKGNVATAYTYNATNHLLTNINTGSGLVQNWTYNYNSNFQLTSRNSNVGGNNLTESFTYDNLNRLTTYGTNSVTYSSNGNIETKTDAGSYSYGDLPHAVTNIFSENPAQIATQEQDVFYNYLNKVSTLYENGNRLDINYGTDQQRVFSKTLYNNIVTGTKHYIDNVEVEENASGTTTRTLSYINSPTGIAAIYDGTNMNFVHTDNLGSFDVITNASGTVLQRNSFDAWGRRRNPTNWTYTSVPTTFLFDRGYTGHEHLDKFALINMNGRVYDPIVGRFLSADPFVQSPGNSQSYNRYSYCMNNPLAGTDPSGYFCSWGPINADRARLEMDNRTLQGDDARGFYAYHGGGFMNTGTGAGPGGLGSGQFGGRIGFFYVGGEAVGVGSNGNGEGTQILEGGSFLTQSGNQYLNSLGLSQVCGEVGQWGVNVSIFHEQVAVSVNGGPSQNVWVSGGAITPVFRPKVDDYKNTWDEGGNVDFKYNQVLNSSVYNFGLGSITNELSIGYQNGDKGPMIEFQNGVISGSANIGDFSFAYSKDNYSAQITYNYTDNKSFTLGASPNSFSWGSGSDFNGYSLYYGSTYSVNMSAAAATAAAIIMYYCPVTVPYYYYFGFGF